MYQKAILVASSSEGAQVKGVSGESFSSLRPSPSELRMPFGTKCAGGRSHNPFSYVRRGGRTGAELIALGRNIGGKGRRMNDERTIDAPLLSTKKKTNETMGRPISDPFQGCYSVGSFRWKCRLSTLRWVYGRSFSHWSRPTTMPGAIPSLSAKL